ncbi:MAG TPA: hypothetical protein ENO29_10710 [Candidatus Aminicenantes bacterium]|nr:MAG: hypothetical protein C0168_01655 [Candidatus Aminicenantes bacterium]HEK86805.1 hypothetical protein [Candidatus Aminicenantes bacterium]
MSRVAVFNKVKKGEIKAIRIGRYYAIEAKDVRYLLGKELSEESKRQIDRAVEKAVAEYGEVFRQLAKE